jgi:hypothetical protein
MNTRKSLNEFLLEHKVEKGTEFTHTSLKGGSYYISSECEDEFIELYKQSLSNKERLHLTEKRRPLRPIIIDLDFRQQNTCTDHKYTQAHIREICYELMKVIDEYVKVVNNTQIYILTKPPRKHNDIIKDGMHIIIPDVVTKVNSHKFLRYTSYKTISSILQPCGYLNDASDTYDKSVMINNLMMYGSNKPDEQHKWELGHVLNYNNGTVEFMDVEIDDDILVDILNIRNKFEESALKLEVPDVEEQIDTKSVTSMAPSHVVNNPESFEYVQQLMMLLSRSRADNYNDWIRVGWCLHNIKNSKEYLELWDRFSQQSNKYKAGECSSLWCTMRNDGLNIGTLCRWARYDNTDGYEQCHYKVLNKLICKSVTGTHYDVARVMHHMYKGLYVSVMVDNSSTAECHIQVHHLAPCRVVTGFSG